MNNDKYTLLLINSSSSTVINVAIIVASPYIFSQQTLSPPPHSAPITPSTSTAYLQTKSAFFQRSNLFLCY